MQAILSPSTHPALNGMLVPNDCDAWRNTDWVCDKCNSTIVNSCPTITRVVSTGICSKLCPECFTRDSGMDVPIVCCSTKCSES